MRLDCSEESRSGWPFPANSRPCPSGRDKATLSDDGTMHTELEPKAGVLRRLGIDRRAGIRANPGRGRPRARRVSVVGMRDLPPTCHQLTGRHQGIPPIVGWPEASFIEAMNEYREKRRSNPVMQTIAGKFSNDDVAALAAYFRSVKPKN
jgi:hypothetical protein